MPASRSSALTPAPPLRLFVALWPSPTVRAALASRRDTVVWPWRAAPVPDARLHLTLHFLGNVPANHLPALVPGLSVPFSPLQLRLGETVAWPHGLVVAQPIENPAALLDLHARLAAALARLNVALEARVFRAHVTLARRAAGARWSPMPRPLVWRVNGYALVWSDRGTYRLLARYSQRGFSLTPARQVATAQSPPTPAPKRR